MAKKISGSVGKGGKNSPADVRLMQELLNANVGKIKPLNPLPVNGKVDAKTIAVIEAFQKQVVGMLRPDARVDANGKTMRLLTQNAAMKKVTNSYQLGAKGATLLKGIEKRRLKPYDDQTGKDISAWIKGATIGYGHLISASEWATYKNGITAAQAKALFTKDVAPFARAVNAKVTVKLSQNQFDALVILAFNIGVGQNGFAGSSVLKLIKNPAAKTPYKDLESAWKAWNKSQGKVMQGLKNRRDAEWNIYSKNVYKNW